MQLPDNNTKQKFINKYSAIGEEKFYKFLITYALNRIVAIPEDKKNNSTIPEIKHNPAMELMEYYEMFFALYRREDEQINLELAKQFRRAANKIYRILLKKGLTEKNNKFLNVV